MCDHIWLFGGLLGERADMDVKSEPGEAARSTVPFLMGFASVDLRLVLGLRWAWLGIARHLQAY